MISDAPAQRPVRDDPPGAGETPADPAAPCRDGLDAEAPAGADAQVTGGEDVREAAAAGVAGGAGAAPAAPVFVDPSGRRRRHARRAGVAAAALITVFLGALGVGVATGADVPLTAWHEPPAKDRPVHVRPHEHAPGRVGGRTAGTPARRGAGVPVPPVRRVVPTAVPTKGGKGGSTTAPAVPAKPSAKPTPKVTPTPKPTVTKPLPGGPQAPPPGQAHDETPG